MSLVICMSGPTVGSDSDDGSDLDDDATKASNETGDDSYFDELLLTSEDNLDIYGQDTGRDGDDWDNASGTSHAAQTITQAIRPRTIATVVICSYVAVRLLCLLLGTPQPILFTTIPLETW